jgi:hypothetical protein
METKGPTRTKGTGAPNPALLEVYAEAVVAQGRTWKMASTVAAGTPRPGHVPAHAGANTESPTATQALQQKADRHVRPAPDREDWDEGLSAQTKGAGRHRPEMRLWRRTANSGPRSASVQKAHRTSTPGTRTFPWTTQSSTTAERAQYSRQGCQIYGANRDPWAIQDQLISRRSRALGGDCRYKDAHWGQMCRPMGA